MRTEESDTTAGAGGTGADTVVLHAAEAPRLVVPGGDFLLKAAFSRDGDDLILTGADGATVIVQDFFLQEAPPTLETLSGARIPPDLATALAGPQVAGMMAQAGGASGGQPIGTVKTIEGEVFATRANGVVDTLSTNDPVFQGDVITTGDGSQIGIVFVDGTNFSLSANARMVLDSLVYDPGTGGGGMQVSALQGAFAFITGSIAKSGGEGMTVRTPVAEIGIRGTTVNGDLQVEGAESRITLTPDLVTKHVGKVEVRNAAGLEILDEAFESTTVFSFFAPPSQPEIIPPAEFQAVHGGAANVLQNTYQLYLEDERRRENGDDDAPPGAPGSAPGGGSDEESGGGGAPGAEGGDGDQGSLDPTPEELAQIAAAAGGQEGDGGDEGQDDGTGDQPGDDQGDTGDGQGGGQQTQGGAGSPFVVTTNEPSTTITPPPPAPPTPTSTPTPTPPAPSTPTSPSPPPPPPPPVVIPDPPTPPVNQTIVGDAGDNVLTGGAGNDFIDGGAGNDTISGGDGDDTIRGGEGDDTIDGGAGNDDIIATPGADNVQGGSGNDIIVTGEDDDTVDGGAGDDQITGGEDDDTIEGGSGTDTAIYSGAYNNGEGYTVTIVDGTITVTDDDDSDGDDGTDTLTGIERLQFTDITIDVANLPTISVDDPVVDEDAGTVTFILTLSAVPVLPVQVDYATADGTAQADSDYVAEASTANFAIGQTQTTVTVDLTDDSLVEGPEGFTLNLSNPVNATIADGSGAATINDDDTAPVIAPNQSFSVDENSGSGVLVGTVLASDADGDAPENFQIVSGNEAGNFTINSKTGEISVSTTADLDFEGTNTFTLGITTSDGANTSAEVDVVINLNDVNEQPTDVDAPSASVAEDAAAGTVVGSLAATDPDAGDSHTFSFASGGDGGGRFEIVGDQIRVASGASFDFETEPSIDVTVIAEDSGGLTHQEVISVAIGDANDAPVVDSEIPDQAAAEDQQFNFTFDADAFDDPDAGDSLTYTAALPGGGDLPSWLSFDGGTRTFTGTPLQADVGTLTVRVTATDGGGLSTFDDFDIVVGDTPDAPVITPGQTFDIAENSPSGQSVGFVAASDEDGDPLEQFQFASGNDLGFFDIDPLTGEITVSSTANLDFEGTASFTLGITVSDGTNTSAPVDVVVNLTNVNEQPTVDNEIPDQNAFEDAAFNFVVAAGAFGDPDAGDSLTFAAALPNGDDLPSWLNFDGGTRTFTGTPLQADVGTLTVRVTATDGDGLSTFDDFDIVVSNTTDAPVITPGQSFDIEENSEPSTPVGTVDANDPDGDPLQSFQIVSGNDGNFQIHPTTGQITLAAGAQLDHEGTDTYTLGITVSDGTNTSAPVDVTVNVLDINENPTDIAITGAVVTEDAPDATVVGTLSASDPDDGDTHTFAFAPGGDGGGRFVIVGNELRVASGASFDHETEPSVDVTIIATDSGTPGRIYQETLTVSVDDANEAPTDLDISSSAIAEDATAGLVVGTLSATDPDSGDSHTFSFAPGGDGGGRFVIVGNELRVANGASFDHETEATIDVTVIATDSGNETRQETITVDIGDVNEQPAVDNPIPDQTANEDAAFSFTFAADAFGDEDAGDSLTFEAELSNGDPLPGWLQFDAGTRTFAGTPQQADLGTITVRVTATDSGSLETFDEFDIEVFGQNDAPDVTAAASPISYDEGDGVINVDTGISVTDVDSSDFDGGNLTVSLLNGQANDTLFIEDQGTGTGQIAVVTSGQVVQYQGTEIGTYSGGTSGSDPLVIALNASATPEAVQALARAITFENTSDDPAGGARTVRFVANDGDGGTSDPADVTLTVNPVNDPPVITPNQSFSVDENSPESTVVGGVAVTDPDGGPLQNYQIVSGNSAGNFQIDPTSGLITVAANPGLNFEQTDSYDLGITVSDGTDTSQTVTVTVNINDMNEPPTDIGISSNDVFENAVAGAAVGVLTVTDEDGGDTHTFSFAPGGDGGGRFVIVGNELRVANGAGFDHETEPTIDVTIIATDNGNETVQKTITVDIDDANEAPTDVDITSNLVLEDAAAGTIVGGLLATDEDSGDTHTFSFAPGGDAGGRFVIDGDLLRVANGAGFDHETEPTVDVTIIATDSGNETVQKILSITIDDANEAPTDIGISASTVFEDAAAGVLVGNLSATDEDTGDTHTFTFAPGGDGGGRFVIAGTQLQVANGAIFDFETEPTVDVTIVATDSGNKTVQKTLSVTIADANEAPTDVGLSSSNIFETALADTVVGTLSATDEDTGDSHTFSFAPGGDGGGRFVIVGNELRVANGANFDHETEGSIDVTIVAEDSGNETVQKTLTVDIDDANEAPTDLDITASGITEDAGAGQVVGTLSATDEDSGDTHTFSFAPGGDGGGRFVIVGDQLRVANGASFDHETEATVDVTIVATDSGNETYQETITVDVGNVNEAPTVDNPIADQNANEGAQFDFTFAADAFGDEDVGDSLTFTATLPNGDPLPGWLQFDAGTRSFTGSPGAGDVGILTVRVTATDNGSLFTFDDFDITVAGIPGGGTADNTNVPEDGAVIIDPLANDTGEQGPLTLVGFTQPSNGTVYDNGNGTVTYVANAGYDGPDSFSYTAQDGLGQSYSQTVSVAVEPDADTPTLTVTEDASGDEDTAIGLTISAALTDLDGSESLAIRISDVPAGAALSAGTNQGNGVWLLEPADLPGLTVTPPPDSDEDFSLTVTAIATEGANNDQTEVSETIDVTVDAVADPVTGSVPVLPVAANEDTPAAIPVTVNLGDTDGSESVVVTISNVPQGAFLSTGRFEGNGVWTLTAADLPGLTITPPAGSDADFTVSVVLGSEEGDNGDTSSLPASDVTIQVTAVPDAPFLFVNNSLSGSAGASVPFNITLSLTDNDGSESLTQVLIGGLPAGAGFNKGGLNNDTGFWELDVAGGELTGLELTLPADINPGDAVDFTLSVEAFSQESSNNNAASATASVDVFVDPANPSGVAITGDTTVGAQTTVGDSGIGTYRAFLRTVENYQDLFVGNQTSGDGEVTIEHTGTQVTVSSNAAIGQEGVGDATVTDGGRLSFFGNFFAVGHANGSDGDLTISGDGSSLHVNDTLSVGVGSSQANFGTAGGQALGMFTVEDGAFANIGTLNLGQSATGKGVMSVTSGGEVDINAENTWIIGDEGVGQANITGGGSVSVHSQAATLIGNLAGSRGSLTVDGAGSEAELDGVLTIANGYFDGNGGRAGAPTYGTVSITNGGEIEVADSVTLGAQNLADGDLTIDGAGSKLKIETDRTWSDGYTRAYLSVGRLGSGEVTIINGGQLMLSALAGLGAGIQLGGTSSNAFGRGVLTVDGTGSKLTMDGGTEADYVNIGRNGLGQFNVKAGGLAEVGNAVTLGRTDISRGELNVDGADSLFRMSGTFGPDIAASDGAWMHVGREGYGHVSVTNGGRIEIDGSDGRYPGFNAGGSASQSGGMGVIDIDGNGSRLEIIGNTGVANIGRDGIGELTISNGGVMEGMTFLNVGRVYDAVGRVTVSGANSQLNLAGTGGPATDDEGSGARAIIGRDGIGRLSVDGGGSVSIDSTDGAFPGMLIGLWEDGLGQVSVSGTGSSLAIGGDGAFLAVGRDGLGTLTADDFANVDAGTFFLAGHTDTAVGSVTFSSGAALTLDGTAGPLTGADDGDGARMQIGRAGVGSLTVDTAASVAIAPDGTVDLPEHSSRLLVGGVGDVPGGVGMVRIAGDETSMSIGGEFARFSVGRNGTGVMKVTDGGYFSLDNPDGEGIGSIGMGSDSAGAITVGGGGSALSAGRLLKVGLGPGQEMGGAGSLTVQSGGSLDAGKVVVGAGGVVGGAGTITGKLVNKGGIINPGESPGTLTVNGDVTMQNGGMYVEINGLTAGQFDVLAATGSVNISGGIVHFEFGGGYLPQIGDTIVFITAGDGITIDPDNITFSFDGIENDFTYDIAVNGAGNLQLTATKGANTGNDFVEGDRFDNIVAGGQGNDSVMGFGGDDELIGGADNDTIDGGDGIDIAVFAGNRADYQITWNGTQVTVTDLAPGANGDDGTDILTNVEAVRFADGDYALDIGGPFQLNTFTTGIQAFPKITALTGGGFVSTWTSAGQDSGGLGVFGQVFDATGNPLGAEIPIATTTAGDQFSGSMTPLPGGGFVALWQSDGQDGDAGGIYGQMFTAAGAKSGGEFLVNTTTAGNQAFASAAPLGDGGFVVLWESGGQDGGGLGMYGQVYDAAGQTVGGEFLVNTTTAGNQYDGAAISTGTDTFVTVWASANQDGDGWGVFAQRFQQQPSATPTKVGGEIPVNTHTDGDQYGVDVAALPSGGFVVTWASFDAAGGHYGIYGQRFDSAGAKVGTEFEIDTGDGDEGFDTSVASLGGGNFVVTWSVVDNAINQSQVYAQLYDSTGTKVGGLFESPVLPTGGLGQSPEVAMLSDGSYVVNWMSAGPDGDGLGVFGQRFDSFGNPIDSLTVTKADGGESVLAANQAPGVTVPADMTFKGDGVLSITGVSVDDPEIGDAETVQVTLAVENGAITLPRTTGLTFSTGDGDADASMTFTGTIDDVNFALAHIQYEQNPGFTGFDELLVTVDDQGSGGIGGAKTAIDGVEINVNPDADAPNLVVTDAEGSEDLPINLSISASLSDPSELLSDITISGVPAGAVLSDGEDLGGGVWSLAVDELSGLQITPAPNSSDNFTLTVSVTSTDGADSATTQDTIDVTVDAVTDVPTLATPRNIALSDGNAANPFEILAALADTDGSESLSVTVTNVPADFTFSAGTDNGGGSWTFTGAELAGLTVDTNGNAANTSVSLSVTATATDGGSGPQQALGTIDVMINPDLTTQVVGTGDFFADPNNVVDARAGDTAHGTLTVQWGYNANVTNLWVGTNAGISGDTTLRGTGTTLNVGTTTSAGTVGTVFIGVDGLGQSTVDRGATMTTDNIDMASGPGSFGTLNVDGAQSKITVLDTLRVGTAGSAGVNITNGGEIDATNLIVSSQLTAMTSGLSVAGPGSTLTVDDSAQIGEQGTGVMALTGGAQLVNNANWTNIGFAAGATGTVSLDGAGTKATFSGGMNIGDGYVDQNMGIPDAVTNGTFTMTNGAVVEANQVTLGAKFGAVGMLSLIGAGTSWTSGTGSDTGFNGMTVGGSGEGSVSVLAGAEVNLYPSLTIGGDETGIGTVLISGADARLAVMDNTDNTAYVSVGNKGIGSLVILSGGEMEIAGRDGAAHVFPGMNIGGSSSNVGRGSVTVSGVDSHLEVSGNTGFINVGRNGDGGLNILDGARVDAGVFMTVGRTDISDGRVSVSGTNGGERSTLALHGMAGPGSGDSEDSAAFLTIGREGQGLVEVEDGALLSISTDDGNFPGISIGGTGSSQGGRGELLVDGAGSEVAISGDNGEIHVGRNGAGYMDVTGGALVHGLRYMSIGNAAGATGEVDIDGDGSQVNLAGMGTPPSGAVNIGAFVEVGGEGIGRLAIENGGGMNVDAAGGVFAGVTIGGTASVGGGVGEVRVSGSNSSLNVTGNSGFITVGRNGMGELSVLNGGTVSATWAMSIGHSVGSVGQATVSGAGSSVELKGTAGPGSGFSGEGAFLDVGRAGNGHLTIDQGAQFVIDPDGTVTEGNGSGFSIGGNQIAGGGAGVINVDGTGSQLLVNGDFAEFWVGTDGAGALNITDGAKVVLANPDGRSAGWVGVKPGSAGTVMVDGNGSELDAGAMLYLGVDFDGSIGGTGVLNVSNQGVVTASQIHVGIGGLIAGDGTLMGDVMFSGGTLAPGNSTGTITIDGDLELGALLDIEIAGTGAGLFDVVSVTGDADVDGGTMTFSFIDGYLPTAGDSFEFLTVGGTLTATPSEYTYNINGIADGFDYNVVFGASSISFVAVNDANAGDDSLDGSDTDDIINGGRGDDHIDAGHGDDILIGGADIDELTGGTGADLFRYDDVANLDHVAANIPATTSDRFGDVITDFNAADGDLLFFDPATFAVTQVIDGVTFATVAGEYDGTNGNGASAWTTDNAAFLQDATGNLYYDPNGSAAGYYIVARLPGVSLTANNLFVGHDVLRGDDDANTLDGGAGTAENQWLIGLGGDDTLIAGDGIDRLTGGDGADIFKFTQPANGGVVALNQSASLSGESGDVITDFSAADHDMLLFGPAGFAITDVIDGETFATIAGEYDGTNGSGAAWTGGTAAFLFDATGNLYYDANGSADGYFIVARLETGTLTANDLFVGSSVLTGNDGGNALTGDSGVNLLLGKEGDDILVGNGGNDTLIGGEGDDIYQAAIGDGFDRVLNTGQDAGDLDIVQITGSNLFDINWSRDGNDLLVGGAVNSNYDFTDTGSLRIVDHYAGGQAGITYFEADTQSNGFYSEDGLVTRVYTTPGLTGTDQGGYTELLHGTGGADVMRGGGDGTGTDGSWDGGWRDYIYGLGGDDTLYGSNFTRDSLRGGDDNDTLFGFNGDDHLRGDQGNDTIDGGLGQDLVRYDSSPAGAKINLSGSVQDGVAAGTAEDGFGTVDTLSNIEDVRGSGHDDNVWGSNLANAVHGRGGNDELFGLNGDDYLAGEDGNDILEGGSGFDTLVGGTGADKFWFGANASFDTVTDFNRGEGDKIVVEEGVFNIASVVDGDNFTVIGGTYNGTNGSGTAWDAKQDAFIFDSNGTLYYDANGSDSGYTVVAQVQGVTLQATDFEVDPV